MGNKGLGTMVATKRSVGVAPELNVRSPLNAGHELRGSILAMKLRPYISRSPKLGYQGVHFTDKIFHKLEVKAVQYLVYNGTK